MDRETPFPEAIGLSSPRPEMALTELAFILLVGSESIDAVRTLSANDGRYTIPLMGPPTAGPGLAALIFPLRVSISGMISVSWDLLEASKGQGDCARYATETSFPGESHQRKKCFAVSLDLTAIFVIIAPQLLFVGGLGDSLSCMGASPRAECRRPPTSQRKPIHARGVTVRVKLSEVEVWPLRPLRYLVSIYAVILDD